MIEDFLPRFAGGGVVIDLDDADAGLAHAGVDYLGSLGVELDSAAKVPDVIVHEPTKDRLLLYRCCPRRRAGGRQAAQGT